MVAAGIVAPHTAAEGIAVVVSVAEVGIVVVVEVRIVASVAEEV